MSECAMGFCTNTGTELVKAFDNDEERLWCENHAELARANQEAGAHVDER